MSTENSNVTAAATATAQSLPPEAVLSQMVLGSFVAQALGVAAKLGIADLLAEKPQTVAALASATQTHERSLYRLLRTLASVGVFAETAPKVFSLTPLSAPLRADAPASMRDVVIFMNDEWHWRVYGNMLYSVQTGKSAWGYTHGAEVFEYFQANPEQSEIFNRAMTSFTRTAGPAVAAAYDFSGVKRLADIAGGHGLLLSSILKAHTHLTGLLFDLPHVLAGAPALLEAEGVADRVELATGDFFAAVPAGADAYIMKHIIHDWDDERASTILRNIARVLPAGGRVLLVEMVIPAGDEPHLGKVIDMEMLVSPGGIERTEEEYRELLAGAGLRLTRIVPTQSPFSVVEAFKE